MLEPFTYSYMANAMFISALVGGVCAFLSAYLMLKGWSLIGDALSHSVVPGVAGAYMLGLPYAVGAFLSGGLAAAAMLFINQRTRLKEDTVIGLIFSGFFGLGLFMISLSPTSVDVQTIIFGNILAVSPQDTVQLIYRIEPNSLEGSFLYPAERLYGRGDDDRRRVFGDCFGGDAGGDSISSDRSVPALDRVERCHWVDHEFCRRIPELLP